MSKMCISFVQFERRKENLSSSQKLTNIREYETKTKINSNKDFTHIKYFVASRKPSDHCLSETMCITTE